LIAGEAIVTSSRRIDDDIIVVVVVVGCACMSVSQLRDGAERKWVGEAAIHLWLKVICAMPFGQEQRCQHEVKMERWVIWCLSWQANCLDGRGKLTCGGVIIMMLLASVESRLMRGRRVPGLSGSLSMSRGFWLSQSSKSCLSPRIFMQALWSGLSR